MSDKGEEQTNSDQHLPGRGNLAEVQAVDQACDQQGTEDGAANADYGRAPEEGAEQAGGQAVYLVVLVAGGGGAGQQAQVQ